MAGWTCRGRTRSCATRPQGSSPSARTRPATHPDVPWAAVVHNGLRLTDMPFGSKRTDALCFVGRVVPEKGIVEAIEIAVAADRPLRIAAKAGPTALERDYFENVFRPALKAAGSLVEFLGELDQDRSRRPLRRELRLADAGVVAGAVRARPHRVAGHRHAGHRPAGRRPARDPARRHRWLLRRRRQAAMAFKVDRVVDLDRRAIRESVLDRFSVERMTDRLRGRVSARLEAARKQIAVGPGRPRVATRTPRSPSRWPPTGWRRSPGADAPVRDRRPRARVARRARCTATVTRLRHPVRSSVPLS